MRVLSFVCVVSAGCASSMLTAKDYRDRGMEELAFHYVVKHVEANGMDDDAQRMLEETASRALVVLSTALEAERDRNPEKAHALSARAIAIVRRGDELGAVVGGANPWFESLRAQRTLAARKRLAAFDASESSERAGSQQQLDLLAAALAWMEDDPELAARIRDLTQRLTRRVRIRHACESDGRLCDALVAEVKARLGQGRLIAVIEDDEALVDAELVLGGSRRGEVSEWRLDKKGKQETSVDRYDRFGELVKKSNGDPEQDEVSATYRIYRRQSEASLRATCRVIDAKNDKVLVDAPFETQTSDDRAYVEWEGDERAVASLISRFGTSRAAPKDPERLVHDVLDKAAAFAAGCVERGLERK